MPNPILLDGDLISCGDTATAPNRGLTVNGIPVVLVGDLSQGHGSFPPTPIVEGSSGFTLNGIGISRDGDAYADHTDGENVHTNRVGISAARLTIEG